MQGTCPNSGCDAVYTLAPQNVGRQFVCRQCGAMLKVEQDGLHLVAETTPAPAVSAAGPRASLTKAFSMAGLPRSANADLFNLVFGAGAVLVIVFTFFPVLDRLHTMRYHADIKATETEFARADRGSTAAITKEIRENREKQIQALKDKADDQEAGAQYSAWWYGWGTMIGFLLLAVSAIAWMGSGYSRTHHVVAAVIICAEMLLIFIAYVAGSSVAGRL